MTGRLAIRGLEGWQLKEYEVNFWGNENAQILLWWWLYKSMNTLKSTGLYILNNGIVYELYLVKLFKNVWAIGCMVQLTLTNTTNNLTIHLYAYFDIYPLHFVLHDILYKKKTFFLMCIFHLIITMSINTFFSHFIYYWAVHFILCFIIV